MHPRILAQRQAQAHGRMLAAVAEIAANLGIHAPDLASIREKSPDVQRVKEWEMLADWTEALVKKTKPVNANASVEAKAPKGKKDDDKK